MLFLIFKLFINKYHQKSIVVRFLIKIEKKQNITFYKNLKTERIK